MSSCDQASLTSVASSVDKLKMMPRRSPAASTPAFREKTSLADRPLP
eukprot:CAMPEP_0177176200 /NCGR_PEP_ID=MMETSP0367-20130122/13125_1 /TAXON_ID=447022 ORGANISM="Scrippsiella hangoei-like, Strain SHHI-4" /NCGR_SAMPLE_ID=MMETSP0367 /ASSEMBLY_ACC=CAM_ASM_000362 /LENGTH=46 /DNA_ID= /DNA_START= /DNA_END= /DNA_ORIENTATION=